MSAESDIELVRGLVGAALASLEASRGRIDDLWLDLRTQKVAGIAADIPELEVDDPAGDAKLLVLGWGSTYGPIQAAARRVRKQGHSVAHAHLHYLNPFPRNTEEVLSRYSG